MRDLFSVTDDDLASAVVCARFGPMPPEKPLLRSNHVIGECMLCPHAIQVPPELAQYANKVCVGCALEVAGLFN
ncbi:hypothetical protein CQ12_40655 [Bradyrhizobium jicamae]|uniref:Uncharacterized protein n=1 Tax=Bradyrhizobium jicamae TaxID=280332 RepID=A0A0R3L7B8_9BRAD|nr:hypothetical protein CQ12_40655 [Bradyrhizobium jicamae]